MFPPSLPENFNAQEWKGIFVQALENVSFLEMHNLLNSLENSYRMLGLINSLKHIQWKVSLMTIDPCDWINSAHCTCIYIA